MYNGIINVYKEKGFTSHDVVAKLRGILKQKKIGHTGTLDPEAEGVLPVCLGKATKLCDLLTDKDKTYEACLRLGIQTDTQDMTGKVLKEAAISVSEKEVKEAVLSYVGEYDQIPPMYSALKVDGRKLYEYAREGIEVERKPRRVTIYSIEIKKIELPRVWFNVACSKGTYIRTLCNDIGDRLGCFGCMETLVRTRASVFELENSLKLSEIERLRDENKIDTVLFPLDVMFRDVSCAIAKKEFYKLLYNGNPLAPEFLEGDDRKDNQIRVYDKENHFIGLYSWNEKNKQYQPIKLFLPVEDKRN